MIAEFLLYPQLLLVLAADLLLGDPRWPLHPVRLIGRLCEFYESAARNRLGAVDLQLVPAAQSGERAENLIAVVLDLPGVTDADSLAAYVGPGVYMVLRHDAATQSIVWRLPGLAGTNFQVRAGDAVYLYFTPGGFYDDLGRTTTQPHLVPGKSYEDDPQYFESPQMAAAANAVALPIPIAAPVTRQTLPGLKLSS